MKKIDLNVSKSQMGILAGIGLIIIIIIITIITAVSGKENIPYKENRAKVEALEKQDITKIDKQLKALGGNKKSKEPIAKEEGQILDNVDLKKAYEDAVIIGDSFTESIVEYGFLDTDVVLYKRGLSVSQAEEYVNTAISLNPSTVFFVFGTNDMENWNENSNIFIDEYRKQLNRLKEGLPDVDIYINGILPATAEAIAAIPSYAYSPQYNEALIKMCEEDGYTFVDCSYIIEGKDYMYEPDGIHMIKEYYPEWLSHLAYVAGL